LQCKQDTVILCNHLIQYILPVKIFLKALNKTKLFINDFRKKAEQLMIIRLIVLKAIGC